MFCLDVVLKQYSFILNCVVKTLYESGGVYKRERGETKEMRNVGRRWGSTVHETTTRRGLGVMSSIHHWLRLLIICGNFTSNRKYRLKKKIVFHKSILISFHVVKLYFLMMIFTVWKNSFGYKIVGVTGFPFINHPDINPGDIRRQWYLFIWHIFTVSVEEFNWGLYSFFSVTYKNCLTLTGPVSYGKLKDD